MVMLKTHGKEWSLKDGGISLGIKMGLNGTSSWDSEVADRLDEIA